MPRGSQELIENGFEYACTLDGNNSSGNENNSVAGLFQNDVGGAEGRV